MKFKILKSGTITKHADGTITSQSDGTLDELNAKAEDEHVQKAIEHFYKHRDIEPLVIEFKEKNTGIFRNSEAMELMAAAMMGQAITGKGRTKTLEMLSRDYYICRAIYHLKEIGLPIKGDADRNKVSACELVGSKFNISASAAYTVWREHEESGKVFNSFELPRWRFAGQPLPEQDEILEYFLNAYIEGAS